LIGEFRISVFQFRRAKHSVALNRFAILDFGFSIFHFRFSIFDFRLLISDLKFAILDFGLKTRYAQHGLTDAPLKSEI